MSDLRKPFFIAIQIANDDGEAPDGGALDWANGLTDFDTLDEATEYAREKAKYDGGEWMVYEAFPRRIIKYAPVAEDVP